ncbi:MAG: amidohydrolase, partial [Chloroflexi bacterium]|nr:amidohydrolase [Chloroflexota bacterium]
MKKYQKKVILLILFITAIVFVTVQCSGNSVETAQTIPTVEAANAADIIWHNGAIYTVNEAQPWAEAVAIKNGRFIYVGDNDSVMAYKVSGTQLRDLEGRMVMPGFQDPHLHAVEAGIFEDLCFVTQYGSANRYLTEMSDCAAEQSGEDWVRAVGANMSNLLDFSQLPIDILDQAVPNRPAIVIDDLGHGVWLNTLAMEAVGYDVMVDDPQGGILVRTFDTDELTGIVLENGQQNAITAAFPPTPENLETAYNGLLNALDTLAQNGITSASDAGGYWPRDHHTVWQRAVDEGTLTVRASNALYVFPDFDFNEQMADLEAIYSNDPDQLLRFNQAKIYVDGILDQGTSALYDPYDTTFNVPNLPPDGFLYFTPAMLNQYATELEAAGFQLHFHVTGDRGAGLALDAIETAVATNGTTDGRHRLTHLYLVDAADQSRFYDLNVIADFQLAPSSTDPSYASWLHTLIGSRANDLLPAFDMLDQDAPMVFSSDWDADVLSPFVKIESILSLNKPNVPELADIIPMMTLDVAYLLHQRDSTGSIEVGKMADLIVLDQNLFEISTNKIDKTN